MKDYWPAIKKIRRWERVRFWSYTAAGIILFLIAIGLAGRNDI